MNIGDILQNEINSAMVTFENHSNDNSFISCNLIEFEQGLKQERYIPIGICKEVPYKPSYAKNSIAFCYQYKEELYWVHLTEFIWFFLLKNIYGERKASEIITRILCSKPQFL